MLAFRGDFCLLETGILGCRVLPLPKKRQIVAEVSGEERTIFVAGEPVQHASQRGAQALGESLWKYNCFTFLNLIRYIEFGTSLNSVR